MRLCSLLAFASAALLHGATAAAVDRRGRPTPPLEDSFYEVPDDIESYAPGAIIAHRKPPSAIASFGISPVNLDSTWQISYRTNDQFGNATTTVVTVLIPHNADFTKLLSYQIAQDSSYLNCAPSYALQFASETGGFFGTLVSQAELLLIQAALEQGWVVITPDHEARNAAYLANKQAGHATLDGIRAALNSASFTGISKKPTIGLWGYSGGSLASAKAAELQPTYAPELNIAGAALGGTVPNITSVITTINKGPFAGIIASGIIGIANQYPEIRELVDNSLQTQYKAAFKKVETQCLTPTVLQFALKDVEGMFEDSSVLFTDPARSVLEENALGLIAPKIPLYVYKSANDELSKVEDTDLMVKQYCAGGAKVKYDRDIVSEHGSLALLGAGKALSFLIDVMNGKPGPSTCTTKTVITSLLDLKSLKILSVSLIKDFFNLLGNPVGPGI